jgi:hypothetical protein
VRGLLTISLCCAILVGNAQCENYTINVGGGGFDSEVSWSITNSGGTTLISGGSGSGFSICLDDGCYNFNMWDSFGDGWNGATYTIFNANNTPVASGNLDNATSGDGGSWGVTEVCFTPPIPCAFELYTLYVGGGAFDSEISWSLSDEGGIQVSNGGAPALVSLCLEDGCYTMLMLDSWGDGWNGAYWSLTDSGGVVVGTGTLNGASGNAYIPLGSGTCDVSYPPQDCGGAITICDDSTFGGNSDGSGIVYELNTTNSGCLAYENQTTWFVFSPTTTGTIEFTINPSNTIDYDFAIWGPYDEVSCPPAEAPLRCSWSALYAPTGIELNTPQGDNTEGAGGDAWVEAITVTAAEVDQIYVMLLDNWTADFTSYTFDWNLTGVILNCQIMLPVELAAFTGTEEEEGHLLRWTTVSENQNSHFEVQRSMDMQLWQAISVIEGQGTSLQATDYQFLDEDRNAGTSYYRLKQVDFNGASTFSDVVALKWVPLFEVGRLFPNPTTSTSTLTIHQESGGRVFIDVLDLTGRSLSRQTADLSSSTGDVKLDFSSLLEGSYILRIQNEKSEMVASERFVKRFQP